MRVGRNFFQKIPFIRITSLFLVGLWVGLIFPFEEHWVAMILFIILSILVILWHNTNYRTGIVLNFLLAAAILFSGIFCSNITQYQKLPSFSARDYYLAEVCQTPVAKAKTFQTVLLIQNKRLPNPLKLIAYFSKDNFDSTLTTGDQLAILVRPQEIRNMGNPFEFDYQTMMERKGIRFSVYLTHGTYMKTGLKINRFTYWAEQQRDKLVKMLEYAIKKQEERSVISALTLGYRAEIDKDTLDYFASTGAMHVLSVSGLHVALIYIILGFLFSFIKRGKIGSVIFSLIMILFLWIYAFLTGFSPSVQRATVMFTFVIIGNSLQRPINIYNSLTASALFLILLDPMVVYDIGFQLSYLAVLGIVLIQPIIDNIFELKNPILKWSWSLISVSFAAQLMTFPLSVFYFNQFPNLFWLSGFVVIPITTLIIWLTLAFFVLSPFHWLSIYIGLIIQKITTVMLFLLKEIDALPLAVTKGIVLDSAQIWFLYGLILTILIFTFTKKKEWLILALSFIIFYQANEFFTKHKLSNQRIVAIYNSKNLMIHLVNGRTNYLITEDLKNITETEYLLVKQVCSHLSLSPTKFISEKHSGKYKSGDLIVDKDKIQFLNCTIDRNTLRKNGLVNFSRYFIKQKLNPIHQTIYIGNLGRKQNPETFVIKRDGAFYVDLRSD